jgi:hypothetical protein
MFLEQLFPMKKTSALTALHWNIMGTKFDHLRDGRKTSGGSHEGRERKRKGIKMQRFIKKKKGDDDKIINTYA